MDPSSDVEEQSYLRESIVAETLELSMRETLMIGPKGFGPSFDPSLPSQSLSPFQPKFLHQHN